MLRPIGIALLLATAAACRHDDPNPGLDASTLRVAPRPASCDRVTSASVCSEYALTDDEARLTASCTKLAGSFALAECPNTSVLGSCTLSTGETRKFYSGGGGSFDARSGKKDCEGSLKGKWSPFP